MRWDTVRETFGRLIRIVLPDWWRDSSECLLLPEDRQQRSRVVLYGAACQPEQTIPKCRVNETPDKRGGESSAEIEILGRSGHDHLRTPCLKSRCETSSHLPIQPGYCLFVFRQVQHERFYLLQAADSVSFAICVPSPLSPSSFERIPLFTLKMKENFSPFCLPPPSRGLSCRGCHGNMQGDVACRSCIVQGRLIVRGLRLPCFTGSPPTRRN